MAPTTRRPATPAATGGVDFGSLHSSLYSGSFTLPEGDYALFFETMMQQPKEGSNMKARLGVKVSAYPLDKPGAEPLEQFLSMGSKAHESFQPSENGKGLSPVVGGPGTLANSSNWNLFRDSLYNAGLPVGIFSDDLSVLDGVWAHTAQIPEPEERKGFASNAATSEVEQPQRRGNAKIPVVTEILDGGKPWEGGGGLPEAKPTTAAAKPGPKAVAARPAPAAAPAAEAGTDEEAVKVAAVNGISSVLGQDKYAASCPKLILKTGVFKAVTDSEGKEMAQAVTNAFFTKDDDLNAILEELGYVLQGTTVKPQA